MARADLAARPRAHARERATVRRARGGPWLRGDRTPCDAQMRVHPAGEQQGEAAYVYEYVARGARFTAQWCGCVLQFALEARFSTTCSRSAAGCARCRTPRNGVTRLRSQVMRVVLMIMLFSYAPLASKILNMCAHDGAACLRAHAAAAAGTAPRLRASGISPTTTRYLATTLHGEDILRWPVRAVCLERCHCARHVHIAVLVRHCRSNLHHWNPRGVLLGREVC